MGVTSLVIAGRLCRQDHRAGGGRGMSEKAGTTGNVLLRSWLLGVPAVPGAGTRAQRAPKTGAQVGKSAKARALYDALRALEEKAKNSYSRHGSNRYSHREVARQVNDNSSLSRRLGEWLNEDWDAAKTPDPSSADRLMAVISWWSHWAKERFDQGKWATLLEEAQAPHMPKLSRTQRETTIARADAVESSAAIQRIGVGRPLAEMTDPFDLEVHRAIASPAAGLPLLPTYMRRGHDRALGEVVAHSISGTSQIAVLVGGSSTGKTRACWEALHLLRAQNEPWRLWHPIAPTPADALLSGLNDIAPYTVVWLNEAQTYLATNPGGEKVAAGLRSLLRDVERKPVLVLATLWPNHWDTLTTRLDPDLHGQARELLSGRKIDVPDMFTIAELVAQSSAVGADSRLGEAAKHARDGQVTQYLAGVPVLMDRYQRAPPAARAVIHAAMDARRLGVGRRLPMAWLASSAPGYLTESEWDSEGDDWLQQAVDYVTTPCNGIPGMLTSVRRGARRNQRTRTTNSPVSAHSNPPEVGPLYQLADYLEQHGRWHRVGEMPPIDFWNGAASYALPADLKALGDAAWARGLYRDSAQLHKRCAAGGDVSAAQSLLSHFHVLHPIDPRPAQWLADHVALDDPSAVAWALQALRQVGAHEHAAALLARRPETAVTLARPGAVAHLLKALREAGAHEQVSGLLARNLGARATLGYAYGLGQLMEELQRAGANEQTAILAERVATHADVANIDSVCWLMDGLRKVGAYESAALLATRAVVAVPLDDPDSALRLLNRLPEEKRQEQITILLSRDPAHHAPLDDPGSVTRLLTALRDAGAHEQAVHLADRASNEVSLSSADTLARLLWRLRGAGHLEQAERLANRAVAKVSLADPEAVARLLEELRESGTHDCLTALLARIPDALTDLTDAYGVARLLEELRAADANDQVRELLARDPAAQAALGDPDAVARLLWSLRAADAEDQVRVLLARNPAFHADLDDMDAVVRLMRRLQRFSTHEQAIAFAERVTGHAKLDDAKGVCDLIDQMQQAGLHKQATALAERAVDQVSLREYHVGRLLKHLLQIGLRKPAGDLAARFPAAGLFASLVQTCGFEERFKFGMEPNGQAAIPWGWEDLA
ncbi:hypothetical protein [Streptomyces sp. NPDC090083]|uniref:hypothetical protein n=1 Tax=Streptomyces sp. NPDC090083 TaxID=3365941 RepID=UPI0038298278